MRTIDILYISIEANTNTRQVLKSIFSEFCSLEIMRVGLQNTSPVFSISTLVVEVLFYLSLDRPSLMAPHRLVMHRYDNFQYFQCTLSRRRSFLCAKLKFWLKSGELIYIETVKSQSPLVLWCPEKS